MTRKEYERYVELSRIRANQEYIIKLGQLNLNLIKKLRKN